MSDESAPVLRELQDGICTLWLNRPEVGNAFDDRVIKLLSDHLDAAGRDSAVRVVVLAGKGRHFSAGADFRWMKRMVAHSYDENLDDALQLARLMQQIRECPKPTLASVNGAAYGGALGLICACDLAIAATDATFCLSEVKLGLIPAVISPYVVAAMGQRQAMRWMLTAETFNAPTAAELGVVHHIVEPPALAAATQAMARTLLRNGPQALGEVKRLLGDIAGRPVGQELSLLTAERIARIRVGSEAQEGMHAFLEKRDPAWRPGH